MVMIVAILALIIGGMYYITEQKKEAKVENTTSTAAVQESENTASNKEIKTYTNSQFGIKFNYPSDKVSLSNNNVFNKNSGRFVNFDLKSGGNFAFDILQDSDKMAPEFANELDEVKFKMSMSAGVDDITKFSELKIGGRTAYKIQVDVKDNNDSEECTYEKIVTKKDGYWYEFYAKICDGNINESLKIFESVATSLEFTN